MKRKKGLSILQNEFYDNIEALVSRIKIDENNGKGDFALIRRFLFIYYSTISLSFIYRPVVHPLGTRTCVSSVQYSVLTSLGT